MTNEEIWELTKKTYRLGLETQYLQHPELHGKIFTPKALHASPDKPSAHWWPTSMSFSITLLDQAGGYWDLIRNWEMEP